MGSFSYTCGVSGLPISYGDKVRYLLVAKNPYDDDNIQCYMHSLWWVRTFPIKASYNDYGSIERVENPELARFWQDTLRLDMLEKGWGDNTVHDVPVKHGMSFEDFLKAVWEGRIEIRQDMPILPDLSASWEAHKRELEKEMGVPYDEYMNNLVRTAEQKKKDGTLKPLPPPKPPIEGIPTMADVEAVLATLPKVKNERGYVKKYAVDEEGKGRIRVRVLAYGSELEMLQAAEKALSEKYATMLTRGTGSYAKAEELLVRPLPTVTEYRYTGPYDDDKKPLRVYHTMIREDVWQALLETTWEGRWGDRDITLETTTARVRKEWEDGFVDRDVIPFTVGLGTVFRMAKKQDWNEETTEAFIQSAAEFYHVSAILSGARHQWRPSYSNGPQFGEWRLHADLLDKWADIADEIATKHEEEYDE